MIEQAQELSRRRAREAPWTGSLQAAVPLLSPPGFQLVLILGAHAGLPAVSHVVPAPQWSTGLCPAAGPSPAIWAVVIRLWLLFN